MIKIESGRKAKQWSVVWGFARLGLGLSGYASAGCSPAASPAPGQRQAVPQPATDLSAGLVRVGLWQAGYQDDDDAIVVGLWKFKFVSKGSKGIPDGAEIDAGYVTWHADGTELMNSGRAPKTGSFCMGAWRQTGWHTFKLNHYALSWDEMGASFIGPTNIREQITVDRSGKSYSGTFTLTQYSVDETTVLAQVKGIVTATRVTAD
jgi:hypothetical protein